MTRFFTALFFLLISMQLFSQRNRAIIDSFVHIEATSSHDSDRLNADIKLSLAYLSINPDSFFLYFKKGIKLAKSLNRQSDLVLLNDKWPIN